MAEDTEMNTITREFTKEQLIAKLHHRLTVAAKYPDVEEAELDAAIFKIALASLTAEPVLYAAEETLAYAKMGELHLTCLSEPMGDAVIPLYSAPPAPVVPDRSMFETWWESQNGSPFDSWDSLRTTDGYCDDGIDGQFEAWNACRASMLQGSQPVSNRDELSSPVIPDGYALVPKEPTEAMLLLLGLTGSFTAMDAAYQKMLAASPLHSATSTDI
ncbi:hypothetical protein [Citrobacter amalonaticus]|uniref:hypothetical protein n=1 Tax=Citrobacter amalonaticus TaxID=35703 RepID=UPI0018A2694A|nr:hypothetical protein [Citrobacter amalonaticus]